MNIDFVSTGLNSGGAERNLMRLVTGLRDRGHCTRVISLTDKGPIANQLERVGIDTMALEIKPHTVIPGLLKLSRWMQKGNADLVQTWMYHANLFGALASRFAGNLPVVWGIRQSNLHPKYSKRSTRLVASLGSRTSARIRAIVCCAESVRQVHQELGYVKSKMVVIPNGVDVEEFKPDEGARVLLRRELKITDGDVKLIGLVGRFDLQKDHRTFLRAAKMFSDVAGDINIVLCGSGINWGNRTLVEWIRSFYGESGVHLLGVRSDVAGIIAGLDLLVSSASYGEGFPNVIAEAMACSVPVVGTDVGETRYLVGDTGRVVQPENPQALAEAMLEVYRMEPQQRLTLGDRARARIEETYSVERMCSLYEKLYLRIVKES
jgi:glycosyltransferase involved in cell wall biosynthesis